MKVGFVLECSPKGPDADIYPYLAGEIFCPKVEVAKPETLVNKMCIRDRHKIIRLCRFLILICRYLLFSYKIHHSFNGQVSPLHNICRQINFIFHGIVGAYGPQCLQGVLQGVFFHVGAFNACLLYTS